MTSGLAGAQQEGFVPMSLFSSMTTAISGLKAQSQALSNIAGNVANSQTIGFKRVDTTFEDLVAQSALSEPGPGGVIANNQGTTMIAGPIAQSDNPLSLALAGQGFFSVSRPAARAADGTLAFNPAQLFTRAGDFTIDRDGYLMNSSGYALRGWLADETGAPNRAALTELRVDRGISAPVPTETVRLVASLPSALPEGTTEFVTTLPIFDALGIERQLRLGWTRPAADTWRLTLRAPDAATPALGSVDLQFGATSGNPVQAGTLGRFTNATTLVPTVFAANGPAQVNATVNFGQGAQPLTLDLGRFGSTTGITQTGRPEYQVQAISQDGAAASAFSFLSIDPTGDVVSNYENGTTRVVARVPVVNFAAPDELERIDGQAFASTPGAGVVRISDAGTAGAARISVSAREGSNVDLATEFSKLIVAQRAYSANTRIVTSADQMLQEAINLAR